MARTVKVSKEKVEKERAREAGDKKLAIMNQRGKNRETEKDTKRNASSQGDPKVYIYIYVTGISMFPISVEFQ